MQDLLRNRDGLWLELNGANLRYPANVVVEEFKSGQVTRKRLNKRQREKEIERMTRESINALDITRLFAHSNW